MARIETVNDLYKELLSKKALLSIRVSSAKAREQMAERIRAVEFVEQLNAIVIFTEDKDE